MGEVLINKAIDRCRYKVIVDESYTRGFSLIYPFTTENIDGYIYYFDLDGKSLLTVGSSGDQAISARVKGAKDITIFDINPYTKFFYYFKVAALIALDMDEFLLFFRYKDYPRVFKDNRYVFKKDLFFKIKEVLRDLDLESYLFWDRLFDEFKGERIRKQLFSMDENRTYVIEGSCTYLKSREYYELAKELILSTDIKFITGDLFNMELNGKYDNIWLSNIGNYHNQYSIKFMIDKMYKLLNYKGRMLVSYLYQTEMNTVYNPADCDIYDLDRTFDNLKGYNVSLESFKGVQGLKFDDDTKDSIILLNKRLK